MIVDKWRRDSLKKNLRVSFRTRHRSAGHGEAVSWGRSRGNQETINLRVFAHITSSHLFTLAISSAICWCCYNGIKVIRAGEMGFCCFSCNSACQSEMGVFWNFTPSLANIRCFCRMDHGFWAEFYWLRLGKKIEIWGYICSNLKNSGVFKILSDPRMDLLKNLLFE